MTPWSKSGPRRAAPFESSRTSHRSTARQVIECSGRHCDVADDGQVKAMVVEAARTQARFERVWKDADVQIRSVRLCLQGA